MPMKPQPARGVVETWGLPPVYRAGTSREFPQNSENFFCLCSMRTWQPRGRERDELRGSFLA
jgi:hypothetical protein